jgi:hypothetical protein
MISALSLDAQCIPAMSTRAAHAAPAGTKALSLDRNFHIIGGKTAAPVAFCAGGFPLCIHNLAKK